MIYLSTSVESKSENLTRVCEATCVVGTHANLEMTRIKIMLKMTVMMAMRVMILMMVIIVMVLNLRIMMILTG